MRLAGWYLLSSYGLIISVYSIFLSIRFPVRTWHFAVIRRLTKTLSINSFDEQAEISNASIILGNGIRTRPFQCDLAGC